MLRQLAVAIVAFVVAATFIAGTVFSRHEGAQAATTRSHTIATDALYGEVLVQMEGQLAYTLNGNPNIIFAGQAYGEAGPDGEFIHWIYYGDSDSAANANATVVTLNNDLNERRVEATITIQPDFQGIVTHFATFRIAKYPGIGYAATIDAQASLASTLHRDNVIRPADVFGCGGTGTGCDPEGVQPADSATLQDGVRCVPGAGSGTCTLGFVPANNYSSRSWQNYAF